MVSLVTGCTTPFTLCCVVVPRMYCSLVSLSPLVMASCTYRTPLGFRWDDLRGGAGVYSSSSHLSKYSLLDVVVLSSFCVIGAGPGASGWLVGGRRIGIGVPPTLTSHK